MLLNKKLIPLTLGGLGIGITEFVMMGLLPDIAKDLSITIPEAGHLISAYALGVVIGAPLLAIIAGKYPPKYILIALMGLFPCSKVLRFDRSLNWVGVKVFVIRIYIFLFRN